MLKRLRVKITAITMALIALLLLVILFSVCHFTWTYMEADAERAMQAASVEPLRPGDQTNPNGVGRPCFVLSTDPDGELDVSGSAYYDLSDTDLLHQLLAEATETGNDSGLLHRWNLYFMVQDTNEVTQYIFMDATEDLSAIRNMILVCTLTFFGTMICFFAISWWLSKWMVRPVERAWEQQRQFVADASHELKTPLTVILTNAELLQSGEYDEDSQQRFTGSILTMASQMRGLVESLLELARVDNRPVQKKMLSPLDLSDLAENCVMTFEPVYFEAGRELESQIEPGIFVRGSHQHLRQVLDILLDNGQKYSTPGTRVTVQLEAGRNHCQLRVISQGKTLSKQQRRDIFKRFYRVDEARSMNRSYGLGLPIAQSIVTQHRGRIWALSKDGVNTFCVSLPTCNKEK